MLMMFRESSSDDQQAWSLTSEQGFLGMLRKYHYPICFMSGIFLVIALLILNSK